MKDKEQYYIYCYTNLINGRCYVGQTNDIAARKRGHKSTANNPKANGYKHPFYCAIRKYGLKNFKFEILEKEIETREQANEREIYWIAQKKSFINDGGYNLTLGGNTNPRETRDYEDILNSGKIFTKEEIQDIQRRLLNKDTYKSIIEFYEPRLTDTFLTNINIGYNYRDPNLEYPLKKPEDFVWERRKLTPEEIRQLKEEIKQGIDYKVIASHFDIKSPGFISMVNTGKYYYDENDTYPLKLSIFKDDAWVESALHDLLYTDLSNGQIGEKYNRSRACIQAIDTGRNRRRKDLLYPLRKHREENKKVIK